MLLGILNKSYYTSVHETNTESSIDLSIDLMKSTNNERRGFKVENIRVVLQKVQFDLQLGLDRGKTLEVNSHQPPPTQRTFTVHIGPLIKSGGFNVNILLRNIIPSIKEKI